MMIIYKLMTEEMTLSCNKQNKSKELNKDGSCQHVGILYEHLCLYGVNVKSGQLHLLNFSAVSQHKLSQNTLHRVYVCTTHYDLIYWCPTIQSKSHMSITWD